MGVSNRSIQIFAKKKTLSTRKADHAKRWK